jgi:hypothetical protein
VNDKRKTLSIIFSCHKNLKFLSTSSKIYPDGRFSHCTNFFKQLFTVHGYKNVHYVPPSSLFFKLFLDSVIMHYLTLYPNIPCDQLKNKSSLRVTYGNPCYSIGSKANSIYFLNDRSVLRTIKIGLLKNEGF